MSSSMSAVQAQLRRAVTRSFPVPSRVIAIPRQERFVLAISWRVYWPELKRFSRSKIIRLSISDELIDLYAMASSKEQADVELKMADALRDMLAAFDPAPASFDVAEVVHWQLESREPIGRLSG